MGDLHKRKWYLFCHWITGLSWRTGSLEGKPLLKGGPSWRTGQGLKDGKFAGIRVFCWRMQ